MKMIIACVGVDAGRSDDHDHVNDLIMTDDSSSARVTKAGGLGILTGLTQPSPEALRADTWL